MTERQPRMTVDGVGRVKSLCLQEIDRARSDFFALSKLNRGGYVQMRDPEKKLDLVYQGSNKQYPGRIYPVTQTALNNGKLLKSQSLQEAVANISDMAWAFPSG
jgi:hypothetical protein